MSKTTIFLADSSVLIDYSISDRSILALAVRHLGRIVVPDLILDEVDQLDQDDCAELGLVIQETDMEMTMAANANPLRGLSLQDKLCFLLAQQNTWTCITNDAGLVEACKKSDVSVWRGLRIMIELVKGGHLTKKSALSVAAKISAGNPLYITKSVLAKFERELK